MTKHRYAFRVSCDRCGEPFTIRLELRDYIDPEWLIKSVPVKNVCERCNVQSVARDMVRSLKREGERV